MKIAVTTSGDSVFQHFGQCKEFTLFDIQNGEIAKKTTLDASGSGHSALAGFLATSGADTLICGGLGAGARQALAASGIKVIPGVTGNIEESIKRFLKGEPIGDPDFACTDHEHHHENGGEHSCNCNCEH